ncbi:lytic murein transglycosylase [Kribbella sp. NPDC055071]
MRGKLYLAAAVAVVLITVVVVLVSTVARPGPGRATGGPLVVSGGVPPEPPPAGSTPTGSRPGSGERATSGDAWGAAGRYRSWATQTGAKVSIAPRILAAYALAEQFAAGRNRGCGVSWATLAAIGSVESEHGSFDGAEVAPDGTSTPAIIGPPLDGSPGVKAIPDTDDGQYDGDTRWDHAVGPMQFLPSTWRKWGVDADGDGSARPHDIDDAAATAAVYLCASTPTMTTGSGWWTAIMTYNKSSIYAQNVLSRSNQYAAASVG